MPSAIGTAWIGLQSLFGGATATATAGATATGATILSGATTALSVGSTGYNIYQSGKIRAEEGRRFEAQQRISSLRAANERVKLQRERRIRAAQNIQAAQVAGGGTEGSSGLSGTLANLGTREAANVAYMESIRRETGNVAQSDLNIFNRKSRQQVSAAIGDFAGTIFDIHGGWQEVGGARA